MNIIEVMHDSRLFGRWFSGPSWSAWLTFLKALFGIPFDEHDAVTYERCTQREARPTESFREAWIVVGRRGGKSLIASAIAVFLGCFKDYSEYLKPGEVGTIAIIAADRRQARTVVRYIRAFLDIPMLNSLITRETQDGIELRMDCYDIVIEVHTASFRTTRGYTLLAVISDEIAFWRSDESANPDKEIIAAIRPGLATIPNSLLLCISSPYARRGALFEAYQRHFGKDSRVLVWQAASRVMNPSLPQSVVDDALAEDEASARSEYLAEFRRDLESFVQREAVDACIVPGRAELPWNGRLQYRAFVDPSGGSSDSMTLAIAHYQEKQGEPTKLILDCLRERRAPFSPDEAVCNFAETLKKYSIRKVTGAHYAGEWPRERFRQQGIEYESSSRPKSAIYTELLPYLNSRRVELLDNPRLISQLLDLERRTGWGGRDSIDHPPNGGARDDLINSAAGALLAAAAPKKWIGIL